MTGAAAERDPVRIGPYRLVHRIGEGGMGVVHLALDADGRAVAIKILRPHVASDEDARRRLGREVETLRRLRDPRVAEVLDADVEGHVPYLVTRFVPGRPLERVVREDGPFSIGATAQLGRDLAGALRAIHAAGVVHRDVKPANVMMLDGAPVLIDFGIAHVADESRLTHTGLVMGTPGYLSPELCEGAPVSEATDWWGWGATLAFAATGRAPFGSGPIEVVLDRVRRGAADLDGVPEPMRSALASALAADPAGRPSPDLLLAGLSPSLGDPHAAAGARRPAADAATEQFAASARTTLYTTGAAAGGGARVSAAPVAVAPPTAAPPAAAPLVEPVAAGVAGRPAVPPQQATTSSDGTASSDGTVSSDGTAAGRPDRTTVAVTVGIAGIAVLAALAAVAPGVAAVVAAVLVVVLRALDRSLAGYWRRRYERGPRRSDRALALAGAPWALLVAAVVSVPAFVLPVLVAASVTFLVGLLPHNGVAIGPDAGPALALGMAAGLLTVGWGPGGHAVRRAVGEVLRVGVRSTRAHRVVLGVLILLAVSATLVALGGTRDDTFVDTVRGWVPGI